MFASRLYWYFIEFILSSVSQMISVPLAATQAKRATAEQPTYPATNISAKIEVLYYSITVVFSLEICCNTPIFHIPLSPKNIFQY